MKFTIKILIAAAFLAVGVHSSAFAQKIDYSLPSGVDFAKYKTYKWQRAEKAIYPAKDLDDMFMRTIDSEFAKKGYTRVDGDAADLIATYQIAILDDMEWSSAPSTIPWVGVAGVNYGVRGATISSSNVIQKGSFILDLYDPKSSRQVWQAHATKTLANTTDFNKRQNNTKKAMAKIFKNFPVHGR